MPFSKFQARKVQALDQESANRHMSIGWQTKGTEPEWRQKM